MRKRVYKYIRCRLKKKNRICCYGTGVDCSHLSLVDLKLSHTLRYNILVTSVVYRSDWKGMCRVWSFQPTTDVQSLTIACAAVLG